ncbi:hypothetical protein ACWCXB_05350 [Streptomyces sp. NPDC001514]
MADKPQDALTDSLAASTKASAHHLLGCPRRRTKGNGDEQDKGQDLPLLLAHELDTEAVRILLPASVARARERLASFTAAMFAGIAARYGGDADHIDIAAASMPDGGDSDWTRRFLVVYDRLPGGTGICTGSRPQTPSARCWWRPWTSSRAAPASRRVRTAVTAAC